MNVRNVKYGASTPISAEICHAFEVEALKVLQALLSGHKVAIVIESEPGHWIPYAGPLAHGAGACATTEEVADGGALE